MMDDVTCPYCEKAQEINRDDTYEDGETFTQECVKCNEEFNITASMSFSYDIYCKDTDHEMEPCGDPWPLMFQCKNCDFYEMKEEK